MSKTVLLIEDNLEMRENTSEILELAKYLVLTASNGKEGVKVAQTKKPDIIICDIMMPVLDGYGVLHMLGKDPATASIPFIFLTAKAEKMDYRKGMGLGADDYLTKPFDDTELLNAIEIRLRKSEILRGEYAKNAEGLNEFFNEASGLIELSNLSTSRESRKFKKKDELYHEDGLPKFVFFINKGKVKTSKSNSEGKEYTIGLFKEGDFVGYNSMLEGTHYTETAEALEDSEIVLIPREDFFKLLFNNRDVAHKFIKLLSNEVIEKEERLLKLAYDSVRKRVAESLVMLYEKYKKNGENDYSLIVSRDDLANLVGTATESVIRTLSDFKDEKLIQIKGSNITILNYDKLVKMRN
jgi:CRP-like cAMP-binding protein